MTRLLSAAVCAAMAGSAAAFAPVATQQVSTTALEAKPVNKELGVLPPVGFFDPLGLLKSGPYGGVEE
eukprot:CAMPEP_0113571414 /NCGR_PEP_ID=MMETSP0015_2-20120614/25538_1 /TAXON_ID=2838 /ORGANISM="Odontella" /LENGTH=67 /DNA_ID=CAMNT_0000474357 /DNA_START=105 /DNA_END=305 /DNA_ORIENTATION=+ /assembly_acc=CAM_ASM_000160